MDLTNDIISYIFTEKQLSLPGLGTFYLKQSSSSITPSKRKIYGPKFDIQLKDVEYNTEINAAFCQFVANKHNKKISQIEDEVHKYSISLLNNLANFGKANINNLGVLKKVNNKLQFEFSAIFQELLKESYPDLPLLLIERKEDKQDIISETSKVDARLSHDFVRKKEHHKTGWIFPLVILTLLSLGFVCLMYCLSAVIPDGNSQKGNSNRQNSMPPITAAKDTTVIDVTEAKSDSTLKSQMQNSENVEDEEINTTAEGTEVLDLEKISIAELIDMRDNLKNSFNKSCIIIVGSFKRRGNSIRMKDRLVKSGFTPYVEKYGRFYRTGVVFDCNEKPLYAFLEELRNSIEKDSWILKYK